MTKPKPLAHKSKPDFPFNPIPLRERHDGWTADRQIAFIDALAASGCVTEAARTVGLSVRSAYNMRARTEGGTFRSAWDNATEFALQRLHDAVLSRAINGVPVPHYYQGKKVGEHRRYDERLAQFLLRTRKPGMFGRYAENLDLDPVPELYAATLAHAILRLQRETKANEAYERESAAALALRDEEEGDEEEYEDDEYTAGEDQAIDLQAGTAPAYTPEQIALYERAIADMLRAAEEDGNDSDWLE